MLGPRLLALSNSPAEITATFPGKGSPNDNKGNVLFDPHSHMNRPALLLLGGRIYIGLGSHCDLNSTRPLYHGWVLVYDATTLKQVGVFCTTPDSDPTAEPGDPGTPFDMGDVWQAGFGLAADPQGFVYLITGNGHFDANVKGGKNYGDTAIKLDSKLTVSDFSTPANQQGLQDNDIDFGSGGPLILPDSATTPQAMLACGKDGQIYLINRQNMGKFNNPPQVLQVVQLQSGKSPDS